MFLHLKVLSKRLISSSPHRIKPTTVIFDKAELAACVRRHVTHQSNIEVLWVANYNLPQSGMGGSTSFKLSKVQQKLVINSGLHLTRDRCHSDITNEKTMKDET